VVRLYVNWVDISLVANQKFLTTLYSYLTAAPALQDLAAECLTQIVHKRIEDPNNKWVVLSGIKLLQVLGAVKLGGLKERGGKQIAVLVQTFFVELTELGQKARKYGRPRNALCVRLDCDSLPL
jgi:exportin-T